MLFVEKNFQKVLDKASRFTYTLGTVKGDTGNSAKSAQS
jgi:hypothetical protein